MSDGIDWYKQYEKDKEAMRKQPPAWTKEDKPKTNTMQDIAKQRLLQIHNKEEADVPVSIPEAINPTGR